MEEKKLVPKLRFPGFTEPWEQRKLGDVVKRESVTQVSSTEYPAIEYEDVIPETGQLNKDIYKKGVQKVGILFDANKVLYGKLRPYLHNWVAPMYTGVAVGDWWVLNPCGLDRGFLYTLIQTVKFDTIANQSAGSKMPRADWKLLSTTEFSIPSLDEQIKIGKLVEGLNDYITLHQRKLEHLKLKKKSLLQKLFPKEGEVYPEFRFPGFTDPWEQRKFGELFLERREKTTEENEDILLSCAITGIYLNSDLFSHFRGSSTVGYLKVRKNDLILSAQNLHLGNANINFNFEHGMISPAYKVFEIESCDPYFVNAWVKKDSTKIFFLKATTEGASQCRKNIDWDALINQDLLTPNAFEQEAIGKFFYQLDRYITLHQRKLEHLQLLKKALLQQLFV